ncbi:unnamed protein product, partial [Prorocentrum cordatum]
EGAPVAARLLAAAEPVGPPWPDAPRREPPRPVPLPGDRNAADSTQTPSTASITTGMEPVELRPGLPVMAKFHGSWHKARVFRPVPPGSQVVQVLWVEDNPQTCSDIEVGPDILFTLPTCAPPEREGPSLPPLQLPLRPPGRGTPPGPHPTVHAAASTEHPWDVEGTVRSF